MFRPLNVVEQTHQIHTHSHIAYSDPYQVRITRDCTGIRVSAGRTPSGSKVHVEETLSADSVMKSSVRCQDMMNHIGATSSREKTMMPTPATYSQVMFDTLVLCEM